MKNILFLVAIITTTLPTNSHARFNAGDNNRCWVDDHKEDEFWFCGKQDENCAKNRLDKKNHRHWQYHGDSFTNDNRTFYCCNGKLDATGFYVETHNFWAEDTTVTKDLGTGTCNWHKRVDVCGNVVGTENAQPRTTATVAIFCATMHALNHARATKPLKARFQTPVSNAKQQITKAKTKTTYANAATAQQNSGTNVQKNASRKTH